MPLVKSASKAAVGKNIKREMAAGRPQKQAVAIAMSVQRKAGGGKAYSQKATMPVKSSTGSGLSYSSGLGVNMKANEKPYGNTHGQNASGRAYEQLPTQPLKSPTNGFDAGTNPSHSPGGTPSPKVGAADTATNYGSDMAGRQYKKGPNF